MLSALTTTCNVPSPPERKMNDDYGLELLVWPPYRIFSGLKFTMHTKNDATNGREATELHPERGPTLPLTFNSPRIKS